jgi:hypothetical protein
MSQRFDVRTTKAKLTIDYPFVSTLAACNPVELSMARVINKSATAFNRL